MNDKTSIKQEIIRYLESQGPKSKSKIEDYIRAEMGNNGDTISRRIREMVVDGVLRKDLREFEGKKYWEYSVVDQDVKEERVIDWSKDNLADALGRPDLKPLIEQSEKLNL